MHWTYEQKLTAWCKAQRDSKDAWIDAQVARHANKGECLWQTQHLIADSCDCKDCVRYQLLRYKFSWMAEFSWQAC